MDMNNLNDGIAEQEQAISNPNPAGLEPETGVHAKRSVERALRRKSLINKNKKTDPACRTRQQDRFV
ncbi:hypothetical protein [Prosthecochloris sp. CIB 2401]|uniref:hypothetical protein n=1 Tax=Prosthecochloris sp. CIB 2401 TaxID=1868325 RepID=UPI00080A96D3|nr:hypothetical protein [Prosthecochloris sp. CIB 2401]ANT65982.1 hypothetical protein Ptc2401_02257 [Prosthecochloris sp. CIB 2401]